MTPATLLHRQVHPSWIADGTLTSQAFTPFPKDDGKLSMYDGDLATPGEAYQHYTEVLSFVSQGVWSVSVGEATSLELSAESSPLENHSAHAHIDFTRIPANKHRGLAKKLRNAAVARGCLHEGKG